jgi:hypothetical protein
MTKPDRTLTPTQHAIIAAALRQAAALELALGNPQVAGLRLLTFMEESRLSKPGGLATA